MRLVAIRELPGRPIDTVASQIDEQAKRCDTGCVQFVLAVSSRTGDGGRR